MGRRARLIVVGVAVLVCAAGAADGMTAASARTRARTNHAAGRLTRDRAALTRARLADDRGIERRINALIRRMTLQEKLDQLTLLSDSQINDAEAAKPVGAVFSLTDPKLIDHYQQIAVQQSRLHIPILFAYDTIHGFRTTFPIPLATGSSFDPSVAQTDGSIGAAESTVVGLKQIYSPMVDVSHEPRWGRISEAAGEDPYVNSVMAAARVKGDQGTDPSASNKVVASVKHFVAYGQPESGRDYNTTDMSAARLWNLYLPPFKAALDAGAQTAMCSFNALNGVPGCADNYTETQVLKRQWGFDGFIESDYTAIDELRSCPPVNPNTGPCGHGVAADGPTAAQIALNAGTDMEMVSTNFRDFGPQLVASRRVPMWRINDAVRRILRVKFRAGLFDHISFSHQDNRQTPIPESYRTAARKAADESMVLLKNDNATLPFDPSKRTAVIGPLGQASGAGVTAPGHDMLGPWWGQGRDQDAVAPYDGIKAQSPTATYTPGCTLSHSDLYDPAGECATVDDAAVKAAAENADQVILTLGETREMSGEAEARSNLDLPGQQQQIIDDVKSTGKPFAVVLFNGRPLTLSKVAATSPAILEAWFGGIEAGDAVADAVFGNINPGGKLPVDFPVNVGQVPIYYNHEPTGRPCDPTSKYNSRHRDIVSCDPLYGFGYGLSYTTFKVSNLRLSSATMDARRGTVLASVDVTNTGTRTGDDVAQLYIHPVASSLEQPVRRLRGFQRVTLAPGHSTTVTWPLTGSDVGYYDNGGRFRVENGTIEVYAGDSSSESDNRATFDVVNGQRHGQGNPFGAVQVVRAAMTAAIAAVHPRP
jgi:beta-glucosidase